MTLGSRRRFLQSAYLYHAPMAMHASGHKLPYEPSHAVVVATDEGCVLSRVHLPVVENHGDATLMGSLYGRGYRVPLVGGYNEKVYPLVGKGIDLRYLLFIVIVGRGQAHFDRIVVVFVHLELTVELVAPDVFAALRYGYHIFRLLLTTARSK